MTSNGSLKELILITNDEYCFLKNQPQHESKRLDYCKKQAAIPRSGTSINLFKQRKRSDHESPYRQGTSVDCSNQFELKVSGLEETK